MYLTIEILNSLKTEKKNEKLIIYSDSGRVLNLS